MRCPQPLTGFQAGDVTGSVFFQATNSTMQVRCIYNQAHVLQNVYYYLYVVWAEDEAGARAICGIQEGPAGTTPGEQFLTRKSRSEAAYVSVHAFRTPPEGSLDSIMYLLPEAESRAVNCPGSQPASASQTQSSPAPASAANSNVPPSEPSTTSDSRTAPGDSDGGISGTVVAVAVGAIAAGAAVLTGIALGVFRGSRAATRGAIAGAKALGDSPETLVEGPFRASKSIAEGAISAARSMPSAGLLVSAPFRAGRVVTAAAVNAGKELAPLVGKVISAPFRAARTIARGAIDMVQRLLGSEPGSKP
jgi:hypothetical protein